MVRYSAFFLFFSFCVSSVLAQNVALELQEMNIIFADIKNPIKIVSTIPLEKRVIKTSSNLILGDGTITSKVDTPDVGYVYIGESSGNKTHWADTVALRIKILPLPRVQLGGLPSDGLPKGRASILAQTSLIASMGSGFAPPKFRYRVRSYELVIVYRNKHPYIEQGHSAKLTNSMRNAMRKTQGGDYMVFRKIEVDRSNTERTFRVDPFFIFIRGETSNENALSYVKITYPYNGKDTTIIMDNMLNYASQVYNLESYKANIYQTTKYGFYNTSYTFILNEVHERILYNELGKIEYKEVLHPDKVWEYTSYYPNGHPKIHTFYRKGDVLFANDSFALCWDRSRINTFIRETNPEDCFINQLASELYRLYTNFKIAADQQFTHYYDNGNVQCSGTLIRKRGSEREDYGYPVCASGIRYCDYSDHTIMDGLWQFYNYDGSLLKTKNYDKGIEVDK
ncbi:MAG: hypothetical protein COA58_10790 [Bacteroidetes bacterium]|nr:MAG: hypothetical protein COA58_10790 [Bacteroidota bacterium]